MPVMRRSLCALLAAAAFVGASATAACTPVGGRRVARQQTQKSLSKLEAPGLVVGEFTLTKVVDGDTVRVDGLDASLRLLGMDTEETIKSEDNRRAIETDWNAYLAAKRSKGRPGRIETPMGMVAKAWATKFFEGTPRVRVERDDPAEIRDRFNRYLAYVFVEKNGKWLNYNVEAVRAGMAPYYTKYGHSRRFHKELVEAMAEAQAAKRGIWASGIENYPDYPQRFAWWGPRAAFVDEFRAAAEGHDDFIDLTHWNAMTLLEKNVGKEVNVFGTIADVRHATRGPARVLLSYRQFRDFPLVFFDPDVLAATGITDKWKQEFVWVKGVPTIYENRYNHRKQVQIQIDSASQIRLCPFPETHATP
jgi:endonuclease YncB( thermonuclease family)